MKSSMKTVFVLLAIVMSFVTVQTVWADGPPTNKTEVWVEGQVIAANRDTGSITVLDLQDSKFPSQNEYVKILAYMCDDADTDRLIAINVTVCVCVVGEGFDADIKCTDGSFECDPETETEGVEFIQLRDGVEFIQLRDYSTYIPFWRGMAAGVTGR